MKIKFDNLKVEALFMDFHLMSKKKGKDFTKMVKKRYEQLKAAETFADYLSTGLGRPHALTENKKGMFGVTITKNIRLIVEPIIDDLTYESLMKCKEVIIKGAEDYHGRKTTIYIP